MVIGELELTKKGVSEYLKEFQVAGRLCRALLETAHISRKVVTIFLFDFVCMFVSHDGNRDLKFGQAATVPRLKQLTTLLTLK